MVGRDGIRTATARMGVISHAAQSVKYCRVQCGAARVAAVTRQRLLGSSLSYTVPSANRTAEWAPLSAFPAPDDGVLGADMSRAMTVRVLVHVRRRTMQVRSCCGLNGIWNASAYSHSVARHREPCGNRAKRVIGIIIFISKSVQSSNHKGYTRFKHTHTHTTGLAGASERYTQLFVLPDRLMATELRSDYYHVVVTRHIQMQTRQAAASIPPSIAMP